MTEYANIRKAKGSVAAYRELTAEELLLVAGGVDTIVVTGSSYDDWWDNYYWYNNYYDNDNFVDYYGGGGGGDAGGDTTADSDTLSEAEEKAAQGGLAAIQQDLQKHIEKYGDFTIKIGDKSFQASDLVKGLDALGKLFDVYDGLQLAVAIANGDASVAQAMGFVTSLAVGFGLTAAGAAPLTVFAVATAAGLLVEYGAPAIVSLIDNAIAEMAASLPQPDPSVPAPIQEYDLLMHLFGIPHLHDDTGDTGNYMYSGPYGSGYNIP